MSTLLEEAPVDEVGTLELIDLEALFLEEIKCESAHKLPNGICTGDVTHRIIWCGPNKLICAAAARHFHVDAQLGACVNCKKPATECWNILPI